MSHKEYEDLLNQGIAAAEAGSIHSASIYFDQAFKLHSSPVLQSYRAYCLAKERGQIREAAKICQESINRDRNNSLHYLIMGRLFLLAGDRAKAINIFRQGLKASPNPRIITELKELGFRKPPVIKQLDRNHPLNRFLGKSLTALRIR